MTAPSAPRPVLTSRAGVTLVGGGPVAEEMLALALAHAPRIAAADGGADRLLALGRAPEVVVGDLDSLSPALRDRLAVHHVAEQDSTDFEKAITRIAAPFVLGVGFLGGRMDHSLAALSSLGRAPLPVVLIGEEDLAFLAPLSLALDLAPGTRLSLFPLAGVGGDSEGLVWPIGGLRFAPDGRVGTSNAVSEGPVRLRFDRRAMLVLLPRDSLGAALAGLLGAPGA